LVCAGFGGCNVTVDLAIAGSAAPRPKAPAPLASQVADAHPSEHSGKLELDAGLEQAFCEAVFQVMIDLERLPNTTRPVLGSVLGVELIKRHICSPYGKSKEAKQRGLKSWSEILRDDHHGRFVVMQHSGGDVTVDLATAGSAAPRPKAPAPAPSSALSQPPALPPFGFVDDDTNAFHHCEDGNMPYEGDIGHDVPH
jgi:hypothetical protein